MKGKPMSSYSYRLGIALSMLINVILGGNIGQTFSARQHEAKRKRKRNLSAVIDFFLGTNHCSMSWSYWQVRKW